MIGSLVGMTAFETVAKVRIGKFKQNILFLSVKVIYLLNCQIDKSNRDESRF